MARTRRPLWYLLPRFPFFIMQQAAPELKRTFLDFVDQKGYFGQIKAMLSQMSANSGAYQAGAAPRPPRTKRPPSEGGDEK